MSADLHICTCGDCSRSPGFEDRCQFEARVETLEAEQQALIDCINLYGDETLHSALDAAGLLKVTRSTTDTHAAQTLCPNCRQQFYANGERSCTNCHWVQSPPRSPRQPPTALENALEALEEGRLEAAIGCLIQAVNEAA